MSRLDVWRVATKTENGAHTSLDEFTQSEPTWEQLEVMADQIMKRNGSWKQYTRSKLQRQAAGEHHSPGRIFPAL
jgi:chemotaxis regulatin CheY-phosphate phosphatase CheZ